MAIFYLFRFLLIFIVFSLFSFNLYGLNFNDQELHVLNGKGSYLADDEGYLLLSLDNNIKIGNIIIKPVKRGNTFKFKNVVSGENFALLKVKAGEYYWAVFWYYFKAGQVRYNYKKTEFTFKVEPGIINYPGTWTANLSFSGYRRAYQTFESINKSSYELKKLRKYHKDIYSDYSFKFQGTVEDNYSNYYKDIINDKSLSSSEDIGGYISYDVKEGVSGELKSFKNIGAYLTDSSQTIGNFNQNGQYLLFKMVDKGVSYIRVLNLSTYKVVTLVQRKLPKLSYIDEVEWIDNDTIYYSVYYDGVYNERIAHLEIDDNHKVIGAEHLNIPTNGRMIDSLGNQENMLYFAKNSIYSSKKNGIYKIDVTSNKSIKKSIKKPYKIIKKFEDAVYWLTASDGEIRFIITSEYIKKN